VHPETAQEALDRDLELAADHVNQVRDAFRRERDRLARQPEKDPVRVAEWVALFTALWFASGDEVSAAAVTALNPDVDPSDTPTFDSFIAKATKPNS